MKKIYVKPEQVVVVMKYSQILCGSVLAPGGDNEPPGAREFDDWEDWNEEFLDD